MASTRQLSNSIQRRHYVHADTIRGKTHGFYTASSGRRDSRAIHLLPGLRNLMRKPSTVQARADLVRLTPRQQEILSLIWDGFTTAEIAHRLKVSARTVEVHRFHMMKKLRVSNLAQLLRAGLERGMIKLKRS